MRLIPISIIILLAFALTGCGDSRPVDHGAVATPPTSDPVTSTEADLLGQYGAAVAKHDKPAEKAVAKTITKTDQVIEQHDYRLLILAGIVILAVGAAVWMEFGKMLGGGIVALGATLVGGAEFMSVMQPYFKAICITLSLAGVGYFVWRHRSVLTQLWAHKAALDHLHTGKSVHDAVGAVKSTLVGSLARLWHSTEAAVHAGLVMAHLAKKASPTPAAPPVEPPKPA